MNASLLLQFLERGLHSSRQLQVALGVSQPVVSRLLNQANRAGRPLVTIGAARSTRYGLIRPLRGHSASLPIYRVSSESAAGLHSVGELLPLAPAHSGDVLARWTPAAVRSARCEYLHEGLPWFIADMCPQGFLGRFFPRQYPELLLPDDISRWSGDDILFVLSQQGHDLPGHWIIGQKSAERWLAARHADRTDAIGGPLVLEGDRARAYLALAAQALAGEVPGSSAGGEQPKFLCRVQGAGSPARGAEAPARAVMVKFSPVTDTPAGVRWADLLRAEHLAVLTLAEAGIPVVRTEIIETGARVFLEITRFDRVGDFGRRPFASMGALADALGVERSTWTQMAAAFARAGLLSDPEGELRRIRLLEAFSVCIYNNDTHPGNLSLIPDVSAAAFVPGAADAIHYTLAPVYDMLPMGLRPRADNSVPDATPLPAPIPLPAHLHVWDEARALAARFRTRLLDAPGVSPEFRALWE